MAVPLRSPAWNAAAPKLSPCATARMAFARRKQSTRSLVALTTRSSAARSSGVKARKGTFCGVAIGNLRSSTTVSHQTPLCASYLRHDPLATSDPLEDPRRAHAGPDAHGHQAVSAAPAFELVEELDGELGAGAAEGVAEGNRAAVDVDLLLVEAKLADDRERLRGEGLVQLDQVDIRKREPSELERPRHRGDRTNSHDLRSHPGDGEADETRQWLQSQCIGLASLHDDDRGGAVARLRRVARRDYALR